MKLDAIVERYVQLRDKKAEMKAAYEASVADLTAAMDRLESAILQTLNEQGVESVRTAHGTAMKIRSTSATVADWDSLLGFIQGNERWDMLEKRVSKTAVEQFRAANDDLPPGVNYKEAITIGIRRA
jgi:nanoRNase/pAp phosphatase (c-di-AMP/oligoRNAs hydrolase)